MFFIQKINVLELVKPMFWIFLFLQTNDHHLSCHGTLVNLSQNNHTQVGKYKIIFSSHWPILLFIIQLISIEFTSINKSKIWLLKNQNQNPISGFYKIQIMGFTKFNINILLFVAKRYNF